MQGSHQTGASLGLPSFIRTIPSASKFHRVVLVRWHRLAGCTADRELRRNIYVAHPAPKVLFSCKRIVPHKTRLHCGGRAGTHCGSVPHAGWLPMWELLLPARKQSGRFDVDTEIRIQILRRAHIFFTLAA